MFICVYVYVYVCTEYRLSVYIVRFLLYYPIWCDTGTWRFDWIGDERKHC